MTRIGLLGRTALRAAQHPLNALAVALALAGTVALDNPLPLALYALGSGVGILALWNWGAFRDSFAAEDAAVRLERAEQHRTALLAGIERHLNALRAYRGIRPLLEEYDELVRMRTEIVRLARERREVDATNESEIVRQVDQMLETYLTMAGRHLVYLSLLTGVRLDAGTSPVIGGLRLPRLQERLTAIDFERLQLTHELEIPSATKEALAHQLRVLEQRRSLLEEAGRQDERIVALLDSIRTSFVGLQERLTAAELVPADVSGFVETAATECAQTARLAESVRVPHGD